MKAINGDFFTLTQKVKDLEWHICEHAVVLMIISGLLEFRTEQECLIFSPGMIVYVPAFFTHFEKCIGRSVSGWFINIPPSPFLSMPSRPTVLRSTELFLASARRIACWGLTEQGSPAQRRLAMVLLDELGRLQSDLRMHIPFPRSEALAFVATQIFENPGDMRSVDHWASVSAMSRRSFTQKFKAATGLTFVTWRQRIKLLAALRMLAAKKSSSEIALALGYKNASTFNVLFNKQFGTPPGKYKRTENVSEVDNETFSYSQTYNELSPPGRTYRICITNILGDVKAVPAPGPGPRIF